MIFYLSGTCDKRITCLSVERIEFPENSGLDDIDWTEQSFCLEGDGRWSARLKEIFQGEDYADKKGALMSKFVAQIEFYLQEIEGTFVDRLFGEIENFQKCFDELYDSITCNEIIVEDRDEKYKIKCELCEQEDFILIMSFSDITVEEERIIVQEGNYYGY